MKKLPEQTWSGENGTLSFGGSGILEPMCYFNGKGELVGYDEIERAVKEAQEFEAQDKKRKEAVDTRNDADAFVFQTEKALNDVGDKVWV